MVRSSILSPLLSAWSAIIHLLPEIFELVRAAARLPSLCDEVAEALAARAIREEKNIGALVTEILEVAGKSPA